MCTPVSDVHLSVLICKLSSFSLSSEQLYMIHEVPGPGLVQRQMPTTRSSKCQIWHVVDIQQPSLLDLLRATLFKQSLTAEDESGGEMSGFFFCLWVWDHRDTFPWCEVSPLVMMFIAYMKWGPLVLSKETRSRDQLKWNWKWPLWPINRTVAINFLKLKWYKKKLCVLMTPVQKCRWTMTTEDYHFKFNHQFIFVDRIPFHSQQLTTLWPNLCLLWDNPCCKRGNKPKKHPVHWCTYSMHIKSIDFTYSKMVKVDIWQVFWYWKSFLLRHLHLFNRLRSFLLYLFLLKHLDPIVSYLFVQQLYWAVHDPLCY